MNKQSLQIILTCCSVSRLHQPQLSCFGAPWSKLKGCNRSRTFRGPVIEARAAMAAGASRRRLRQLEQVECCRSRLDRISGPLPDLGAAEADLTASRAVTGLWCCRGRLCRLRWPLPDFGAAEADLTASRAVTGLWCCRGRLCRLRWPLHGLWCCRSRLFKTTSKRAKPVQDPLGESPWRWRWALRCLRCDGARKPHNAPAASLTLRCPVPLPPRCAAGTSHRHRLDPTQAIPRELAAPKGMSKLEAAISIRNSKS